MATWWDGVKPTGWHHNAVGNGPFLGWLVWFTRLLESIVLSHQSQMMSRNHIPGRYFCTFEEGHLRGIHIDRRFPMSFLRSTCRRSKNPWLGCTVSRETSSDTVPLQLQIIDKQSTTSQLTSFLTFFPLWQLISDYTWLTHAVHMMLLYTSAVFCFRFQFGSWSWELWWRQTKEVLGAAQKYRAFDILVLLLQIMQASRRRRGSGSLLQWIRND